VVDSFEFCQLWRAGQYADQLLGSLTILLDIFKKGLFFWSPSANFTLFFMPRVSALPLGAECDLVFAEGETKNVQ
jgi:hypothetical protein